MRFTEMEFDASDKMEATTRIKNSVAALRIISVDDKGNVIMEAYPWGMQIKMLVYYDFKASKGTAHLLPVFDISSDYRAVPDLPYSTDGVGCIEVAGEFPDFLNKLHAIIGNVDLDLSVPDVMKFEIWLMDFGMYSRVVMEFSDECIKAYDFIGDSKEPTNSIEIYPYSKDELYVKNLRDDATSYKKLLIDDKYEE